MSRHPLVRLMDYFGPQKRLLGWCMGGLVLGTTLNLAGPWIVARAIDVDLATGDWPGLVRSALLYLGLLLVTLGTTYASRIGLESVAQGAMLRLKERLFGHLLRHDLAFHDRHPSGQLITRIQGDTESLRVLFAEVILALPADIVLLIGMFVVMIATAPHLALYVGAVLPPYVGMLIWFRRHAPKRFLEARRVQAALTGFWAEHVRALPMLQQLARQDWVRARASAVFSDVYEAEVRAHLLPVYYFNGVFLVRTLGMAAVLCLGALQVAKGQLTVGALVMGLGYLRLMFNPLMRLSFHLTTVERSRAAAVRIAEILDTHPTIVDPEQPAAWPGLRQAYRLEDVCFEYEDDNPVLRDVSLTIPAGSHVGIVGPTGSGKSTLLNLLLRFRDPTRGRVTVDGVDLRDLRIRDVRDGIGLVQQDVHLFTGTVLDNLGGDPKAAARACATLGIGLPLDAPVREGGNNLSRGERQLLTFARALVHDPDVLVLDEATSAVDPATEARVQSALSALQRGRTTITVAHRLATVRRCDTIFVLLRGAIVESGTHAQLISHRGFYAALYELQHGTQPGQRGEVEVPA